MEKEKKNKEEKKKEKRKKEKKRRKHKKTRAWVHIWVGGSILVDLSLKNIQSQRSAFALSTYLSQSCHLPCSSVHLSYFSCQSHLRHITYSTNMRGLGGGGGESGGMGRGGMGGRDNNKRINTNERPPGESDLQAVHEHKLQNAV